MGHQGRPEDWQPNLFRRKERRSKEEAKQRRSCASAIGVLSPIPYPWVSPSMERSTKGKALSDLSCSHRVRTTR